MGFRDRLRELRESRGLSQEQLADALGIPRSTITHYETSPEERLPRRERLQQIADYFGVTIDWLLMGRTADDIDVDSRNEPTSAHDRLFYALKNEPKYMEFLKTATEEEVAAFIETVKSLLRFRQGH